jgi:hypothetical protein
MKKRYPNDSDQVNMILETQEQLDAQTADSLEFFKLSQESFVQQQNDELKRLTAKYGRNHVRVQMLESKVHHADSVSKAVDVRLNIMKTQADPLPADGWRIQGYVFTTAGDSLPGHTVLIDAKKDENKDITRAKPVDRSSSNTTSEMGFYSITLTAEELKRMSQYTLYLTVLDSRRHIIFTSKEKLNPTPGTIDFQDVVITVVQEPAKPRGKTKGKGGKKK